MKKKTTKRHLLPRQLYLPLAFLLLVIMDVGFRFLYRQASGRSPFALLPLAFTLCWAVLLCGLAELMPSWLRRVVLGIILTIACLMPVIHGAMFRNFGTYFSFADLAFAEDGARFMSLTYLKIRKAQLLLSAVGLFFGIFLCWLIPKGKYRWYRPVLSLVAIAVAVAGLMVLDGRLREKDKQYMTWDIQLEQTVDQKLYAEFTNTLRCMELTGSYQYLWRNAVVTFGIEDAMKNGQTYERLDQYYASTDRHDHPDNEMTGVLEGKNVLLVLLESIDSWMLTEDYMPNLYALQQKSVNFASHYSPMFVSGATFAAEFTVNTGFVAPPTGISNRAYTDHAYPASLANLFRGEGYSVNSFHSASPAIYNRGIIHENWGYEAYHSGTDLGMEDYMRDSELIRGYDQMTGNAPFFSFLLTYSGHGPYTAELDNISEGHWEAADQAIDPAAIPAAGDDLEEYRRAIAHAMETDAFIGELVAQMESDGHLEDTVLVFFTDHYNKYMSNRELVMKLKGAENRDQLCKTPFFIYSSDLSARTVTKVTATMDIFPTLANLFGLDVDFGFYPGDDAFSDRGGYAVFPNLNWYDGATYYNSEAPGELTEEIQARNQEISEKMNAAWDTLRCNYFARENKSE